MTRKREHTKTCVKEKWEKNKEEEAKRRNYEEKKKKKKRGR